jgi:hypothetical protein
LTGGHEAAEEAQARVSAGLFDIAGRQSDLADDSRQAERARERAHEPGVGAGLLAAKAMVEVKDRQAELLARGELTKNVQEADGIGAARDRYANAATGLEHPMAVDEGGHAL